MTITKKCPKCNTIKKENDFCRQKKPNGEWKLQSYCKMCKDLCTKKWRVDNREHYLNRKKITRRKRQFGLTEDDFNNLLIKQNYVCAICKKPNNGDKSFAIDHCHKAEEESGTMKIRGLLCDRCNRGIGLFQDNISLFENVINYLKGEIYE